MRTARTLEAEQRQVLRGSVSTGAKEDVQVLGAFGLLDLTILQPVLPWRAF
jgi:plasmid stability protein